MKAKKLYNVIFPLWLVIWLPNTLWLFIIPLNLIIDFLVLYLCQKKLQLDQPKFLLKHGWKTWLLGFVADICGSVFLLAVMFVLGLFGSTATTDTLDNIGQALIWNCFTSLPALFITLTAVLLSGLLIYKFNHSVYERFMDEEEAHYIALRLAVFTAPYLFLIPIAWFY